MVTSSETSDYPFISVFIPTKNEEEFIGKLLESLSSQTYPPEYFEILLFDGMSQDNTLNVVEGFHEKLNLKVYENQKIRQVYAWNKGIENAKGDYFIIIGAHSYLDSDFLKKSMMTYQEIKASNPELAGVGGSLTTVYKNRFAKLVKLLYSSPFAGVSSFWSKEERGFKETVVFGLYDKKLVTKVGMFDEDFIIGDDYELNLRLNRNGYKLYSNPDIKAYYFTRSSPRSFTRQSFEYGAVKGLCIRSGYNKMIWWVPLLFLLFELALLTSAVTSFFTVMMTLFALYFIASILFSFYIYVKSRNILALSLIVAHFIYHNIVALGFLKGLIRGRRTF